MKRIFALILCCAMVLTIATGCKKDSPVIELNEARYVADLAANDAKYSYTYAEGKPTISHFTIVDKREDSGMTVLTVTATATNNYVDIDLEATMEYVRENNYWRLSKLEVTKAQPIPTTAPNLTTLLEALNNYTTITGGALAVMEEQYHTLTFAVKDVTWGTAFDAENKTAQLSATYFGDSLSFTGYYDLIFTQTGWVFETKEQEDGRHHPLLRLKTLEQNEAK